MFLPGDQVLYPFSLTVAVSDVSARAATNPALESDCLDSARLVQTQAAAATAAATAPKKATTAAKAAATAPKKATTAAKAAATAAKKAAKAAATAAKKAAKAAATAAKKPTAAKTDVANFITHEIPQDYVIGIGGALNAALTGVPKGARQILLERGLWDDISHKVKDCAANKKKVTSNATVPATDDEDVSGDENFEYANGDLQVACTFDFVADSEPGVGTEPVLEAPAFKHTATCCMTGALLNQSDFHAAHTAELFNMIQARGHRCVFLPKFHSELNPIERWWALLKAHCRDNCRFHISTLENTMLAAVEACTIDHPDFIKKSFQTTLRYLLLYAAGLNGIEAKQLATVISNKRQATLKVQFVAGRYFTSFHSDKCEMQRLNWYAVPYKQQIISETPREVTNTDEVKGDEIHREGSQHCARTFDAARSHCCTAQC